MQIAGRTGCAVLGVVHFTKNTEKGAFLSIQASGAFGKTAQHVLAMVESPDERNERILSVSKTNVSEKVPYIIEAGPSEKSADEALNGKKPSKANIHPEKIQACPPSSLTSGSRKRGTS